MVGLAGSWDPRQLVLVVLAGKVDLRLAVPAGRVDPRRVVQVEVVGMVVPMVDSPGWPVVSDTTFVGVEVLQRLQGCDVVVVGAEHRGCRLEETRDKVEGDPVAGLVV